MPVADAAPATSLADLPALLQGAEGVPDVIAALRAGRAGTIDGAWGSSAALSAATLAAEAPATVLVVLAHPGDIEPWANDLAGFAGARPVVFPAFEAWPPEASAFDETPGRRLRILQKLAIDPSKILLASMAALMQPVPARGELAARGRRIRVSDTLDLEEIGQWLVANGYKRLDAVELPGEFSRRGGILDVFSLDAEDPVRLEFFGDDVESIRPFSAGSQRSLGDVREVVILGQAAAALPPSPPASGGE
ncbi:MAG TPA: transcription-repair coupling factor, partial [Gemmataceae bacterium]|nr:transcription-repair coupling factor [Gemmataceae bacterium]